MMISKNNLILASAIALLASCGGAATVDQSALDAKISAKVKNAEDQLKTDCDARIIQTSQMRADSVKMAKAAAKAPIVVPATTKTVVPAAVAKVPVVKTPVPVVKTPVVKTNTTKVTKPVVKTPPPAQTVRNGGLRSQSDAKKVEDKKSVQGGGLRSQSDQKKTEDSKAVQGGGLRSQSDQNRDKK